jgi:hypothetical protein
MVSPVDPGPVLRAIPPCEDGGECPALTAEQDAALWQYLDALELYAARAWRACGPRPGSGDRAGAGGGGAGDEPAP